MKKVLLGLVLSASVGAFAAANGAINSDGDYEVTVASGDVVLSAEDVTALGTHVNLVKKGLGRLIIDTNLRTAGWDGEVRVKEGYLRARQLGALGKTSKGTFVSDGATFEVDGSVVGGNNTTGFLNGEPFTIIGRGMQVDGVDQGVIRNVANDQYPGVGKVTMLGNCLYATGKENSYRLDCRSATLDMNGYTLTTRGYFALTVATIANPGNIVVEEGRLVIESVTKFNGSAANKLTIAKDAVLYFQGARGDMGWTLELNDGSTLQSISTGTDSTYNTWSGPVVLVSGMAKIHSDYRYSPIKLTGSVSGAGGVNATATSKGTLKLMNAENTFTGGLTISGSSGHVYVAHPGGLPHGEGAGAISLTGQSATLCAYVGDDETTDTWSTTDFKKLVAKAECSGKGSAVVMWNEAGETKTFAEDVTENIAVGHGGTGSLTLGGTWQTGDLTNLGGDVGLTEGEQMHIRFLDFAGGTLTIPQGALVYSHTNAYLGAPWPDTAKIVVENGGCYMTSNAHPQSVYYMSMGRTRNFSSNKYRGIIDLQDGASMTGRVCVGTNLGATDMAALYVRNGANFYSHGTGNSCDMYVGGGGGGYVEIDGWMYMPGWTIVGSSGNARAVWVQKGGEARCAGDAFSIGASGGRGEAYFCGGTFTCDSEIHVGKSVWSYTGKGSRAALTVATGGNVITKQAVDLAMQTNCLAALNLNGGVLEAKYVQKMTNILQLIASSGRVNEPFDDNTAYVNFNGGTFKARESGELFPVAPDAVTVNPGGAVFDTAGYSCTVGVPLVAPSGKGIASIPLPASCSVPWNYIGSPYVTIDGDGTNAWAHAVFDSESGVVTGIEITNPGMDYTWAKATLSYGGWTNQVVVSDLPLAANTSGGLVKKGKGQLTLNAVNTFAGAVTVEGGMLVAGNDRALPTSAFDLSLTGGTLDGGGHGWMFGAISATSGGVVNVMNATAQSLTKTGAGTFDLESPIAVSSTIQVKEGTFRLPQVGAGLWQAAHAFSSNAERTAEYGASPVFKESVSTGLEYLHVSGVTSTSLWKDYMNVYYSGYIWNTNDTAQTWTFAGVMDDGIKLVIDGRQIFYSTGWTTPKAGRITVSPGPHRFYVAAYNNTGGAGATGTGTSGVYWPSKHGLMWAPTGSPSNADGTASTNYYDYVDIADPERGAVFSLTPDGYEPVATQQMAIEVAAGATVVVGDGAYAFTSYKGLGSITGSTSIQSWVIDGAEVAAGGRMHVTGDLTFPEGATFSLENTARLPTTGSALTIGTVDGTITGRLPSVHVEGLGNWSVFASGHELKLAQQRGTILLFR